MIYHRVPFSRATNFCEWSKKGSSWNYFHETTLAELFTVHVNLHAMEFPLIFGETNFVKVPKICKICGPGRKSALQYIRNNVTQYSTCTGPYCSSLVLL